MRAFSALAAAVVGTLIIGHSQNQTLIGVALMAYAAYQFSVWAGVDMIERERRNERGNLQK